MGDYACKTIGTSKDLKELTGMKRTLRVMTTGKSSMRMRNGIVLLQTRRMYNDYE